MRGRTTAAVVAAFGLVPALATAEPRTITITTTTTVTLEPDAAVTDLPPGETPPNATITSSAAPAGETPTWRATVAGGLASTDEAMSMLDARLGVAISRRLRLAAGITTGGELDKIDRLDHYMHAETASLQYFATTRAWLELGLGVGAGRFDNDAGFAMTAAFGADIYAGRSAALNLQLRGIATHDGPAIGLLVGASFY